MKIYLWYDSINKKYITGRTSEYNFPSSEALFAFDLEQMSLSRKITRNLNKIR